ncbi:hypothetical protein [Roseibium sp.]|uniref:hypothetical protein n=1 Tax=Roseibium sp. TaxID=1936156 RepID=UPI003BAB41DB
MIRPTLPAPTNAKPLHFAMLATALCVLTFAHVAERGYHWFMRAAPLFQSTPRHALVSVTMGPDHFRIPAGYFKSATHRLSAHGEADHYQQVSLLMTWPDLRMPGEDDATAQLGTPLPLIQVDLEHDPYRETLRTQLDPVYKRLARGGARPTTAGLNMLMLSARAAQNRDIIVYDPEAKDGFIARCVKKRSGAKAVCHRTVTPGGGQLIRYQFDQTLLPSWRELDAAIKEKVSGFRT